MKLGNFKIFIFAFVLLIISTLPVFSVDEIEIVPLINLEDLSPTFEEDKDELEKINEKNTNLDKITAKTTAIRLGVGEKKFFASLEIKALKCLLSENSDSIDTVAYLQVKDLSAKDNNQVFLFNGWAFVSSPTLHSIDHPLYDLWVTSCENI